MTEMDLTCPRCGTETPDTGTSSSVSTGPNLHMVAPRQHAECPGCGATLARPLNLPHGWTVEDPGPNRHLDDLARNRGEHVKYTSPNGAEVAGTLLSFRLRRTKDGEPETTELTILPDGESAPVVVSGTWIELVPGRNA